MSAETMPYAVNIFNHGSVGPNVEEQSIQEPTRPVTNTAHHLATVNSGAVICRRTLRGLDKQCRVLYPQGGSGSYFM